MTGFEFEGNCFATSLQAQDAYYARIQPFTFPHSPTTAYTIKHQLVNGDWYTQNTITDLSTGSVSTISTTIDDQILFRICSTPNDPYNQFMDGMQLGWGVAIVMVITFLIWRLKRI